MKLGNFLNTLIMTLVLAGLAACGGGSGGGGPAAPTSGSTVVGTIGGFGSVIMSNGNEYSTDNVTSCEVDDVSVGGTCEESLAVGMSISMQVSASGAVSSIKYDDELEGPVTNVAGADGNFTFDVFGANVMTTNPGTQWRDFTTNPPDTLELDGANIEVSGEWHGTTLNALYVEKQNDSSHEAKGTVGEVTGSTFPLMLKDGTVIDVDATGANLIPQEGDYAEVKGNYDGTTFTAIEVELEDEDDFDSDGEAEITGTLIQDDNSSTGYSIGNTEVDIINAPGCEALVGTLVEAEGTYDEAIGVLLVEECEDEDDELEMKCSVMNTNVPDGINSPKVGSLDCSFPGVTETLPIEFRDVPELAVFSNDDSQDPIDLTVVHDGDCVEIKASTDTSANTAVYVAGLIELESVTSACSSYKLEGPVDEFTDNVSIVVLGVTFIVTTGITDYPDGMPVMGDIVKIVDAAGGDGVADSVEID